MKILITYILILFSTSLFGQEKTFPSLKPSVTVLLDFIPSGWEIYDIATGDLNNDGEKDYAVILQTYIA